MSGKGFDIPTGEALAPRIAQVLERARASGATAADASLGVTRGLSVSVRKGEVESVEFHHDRELSLDVFFGRRTGSASTGDLSDQGIAQAVDAACAIAKASGEDPCNGLADAHRMATRFPDLALDHRWDLSTEDAIERARAAEGAALAVKGVNQTEGASLHTSRGVEVYGNTHGFLATRYGSNHYVSCSAIAGTGENMQRDDWYTSARDPRELEDFAAVGRRAGERAVARLGAKPLSTRVAPVLFVPDLARGFFGHYLGAIAGGALYRKASFLLDKLGQPVFAPFVRMTQQPFLPRAAASAAYDNEGVATAERTLVEGGVLKGWVLSSYSARKLGLETTGNAGGVYNLVVEPSVQQGFDALVREMGEGLVVTELMGQGVNGVTGDYSRGAAGFWVEGGKLAYPVQEVTIAGNLLEMYRNIKAIGNDVDIRGGIRTGSVLVEPMTIAGR